MTRCFPSRLSSPTNIHFVCTHHIMTAELKVAILVVSDTASEDPKADKVVDALKPIIAAERKWESPASKIVPDNVLQIQQTVCNWTDSSDWYNLILLSGGTGFAVKDNTPEVRDSIYAICQCS